MSLESKEVIERLRDRIKDLEQRGENHINPELEEVTEKLRNSINGLKECMRKLVGEQWIKDLADEPCHCHCTPGDCCSCRAKALIEKGNS